MRPPAIGVTGTVVEDTIDTADGVRTQDLGGITYALATLSALLPESAVIRPVLHVGEDSASRIRTALARFSGLDMQGLVSARAVNNKVHLEYRDDGERDETLTGGVPPLEWPALAGWVERLDAWLWNFISGMETDRATFARVKAAFAGPIHLDLHSLCLDHVEGRARRHRAPERWESWVEDVTWVQTNVVEAGLLGSGRPKPLPEDEEAALAERIHGLGAEGLLVTRAEAGATWYGSDGEVVSEPAVHVAQAIDSTGCGDVFGAAWVALRVGHRLAPAAALAGAVQAAGEAAALRGTRGLSERLARAGITPGRRPRWSAGSRGPTARSGGGHGA